MTHAPASPLRVTIWGLGPHALRKLVPAVASARGLDLYGVCSRNAAVVDETARTHGCRGWTGSAAMLADPHVDVVLIATPIGLHFEGASAVLAAGKHCWVEKPFTAHGGEAAELVARARDRQLTVAEGLMYLFHPQFEAMRRLVADGTLGALHTVHARFGIPTLAHPGFRDDPALGGGAFLDVGCYPLSAASEFLAGEPEVMFAEVQRARRDGIDHAGRAILRDANGVTAALDWAVGVAYRNELDLWGVAGSAFTDRVFSKDASYAPDVHVRDGTGARTVVPVPAASHFVRMLEAFRSLVDNPQAARAEQDAILRRARLRDRVRDQSSR